MHGLSESTHGPLRGTTHAWQRWRRRAPRWVRSHASFTTALHTARDTGETHHGCAVYRAFGMALLVRDGHVLTCWPLAWNHGGPAHDAVD